ncbi:MAG TPA: heparan-alpha-glucosaminide N-acetyltransferase [Thermomicrobiales bacterium]|nr:heparan-alpha-glucosaminide N-acetyltransferase [Thermomicrobiales bacterium]
MDGEYLDTNTWAERQARRRARRQAQPVAPAEPRFWEIDAIRGIAIGMMVLYHLVYDLDYFGDFDLNATSGFWRLFATTTAFLFVFLVGVSLAVSYDRSRQTATSESRLFRKYASRGVRVLGYGMLITLVIWLAVPDGQIYFGILHAIGLSIILAYPFLGRPKLALLVAVPVLLAAPVVETLRMDEPWLLWLGVRAPVGYMFDYRPVIPWFGVALLGIVAASYLYRNGERRFPWPVQIPFSLSRQLATLGRYSLVIYLLHQPLLLGVMYALGLIDLGIF